MTPLIETLTSLVFRLGVERDELDPDRDGGLSADGFELLPLGLSFLSPFNPITMSRDSRACSPFGRGDGDSYFGDAKQTKTIKYFSKKCVIDRIFGRNFYA